MQQEAMLALVVLVSGLKETFLSEETLFCPASFLALLQSAVVFCCASEGAVSRREYNSGLRPSLLLFLSFSAAQGPV